MIEIKEITKTYDGHKVLDSFSLKINDGAKIALMGPSGCGKTTLFMILSGLVKPDEGEVIMPESTRFSAVFQDDRLCENLSLYANLKIVCNSDEKKAEMASAINLLGLKGHENKYTSTLSGGMKRRASVIRAMLADFDVLVLDEPFNGLDPETKKLTADYILSKLNGRTLIMITHNIDDVELIGCEVININKEKQA